MMMKAKDKPSAEERRKFSMIWGVKTTTQQAMEIEPRIPDRAVMSMSMLLVGDEDDDDDDDRGRGPLAFSRK